MFNAIFSFRNLVLTIVVGLLVYGVAIMSVPHADPKILNPVEQAMKHRVFWGNSIGCTLLLALVGGSIAIARGQDPRSIGAGLTVVVCFLALGHAGLMRISERKLNAARMTHSMTECGSERSELQRELARSTFR